jgi:alpha-N-arabinofuranosidase
MTGLERNGDVVRMSSYALLFSKIGHSGWEPDLIHFTNTQVYLSINYYVRQMFSSNSGDTYLDFKASDPLEKNSLALSAVKDGTTGDLILKPVNYGESTRQIGFTLPESYKNIGKASETVLGGDPNAMNDFGSASSITPKNSTVQVERHLNYTAQADSLTVLRFRR